MPNTTLTAFYINSFNDLRSRHDYFHHFTNEETKMQRGSITCPWLHNKGQISESRQSGSKIHALKHLDYIHYTYISLYIYSVNIYTDTKCTLMIRLESALHHAIKHIAG